MAYANMIPHIEAKINTFDSLFLSKLISSPALSQVSVVGQILLEYLGTVTLRALEARTCSGFGC